MISVLLDVALGLILLYLVLSVTASGLNEQISSLLQLRAKNQQYFMLVLLGEQGARKNSLLRYVREALRALIPMRSNVTNTPPLNIDDPLADVGAAATSPAPVGKETHSLNPYTDLFYYYAVIDHHENGSKLPVYINETEFSTAILEVARHLYNNMPDAKSPQATPPTPAVTTGQVKSVLSFEDAKKVIEGVGLIADPKYNKLKIVITTSLQKVMNEVPPAVRPLEALRKNLESWYIDAMKRLIGTYTSQIKRILLLVAFVLVLGFNIDSLTITNSLLESPAKRDQINAQSGMTAENLSARATLFAQSTLAAQATATQQALNNIAAGATASPPPSTASNLQSVASQTSGLVTQLQSLDIPLGWSNDTERVPQSFPDFFGWLIKKLLGLGITIVAITQGAPFWFDMLNKVTNLRNSGKPPDQSQTTQQAQAAQQAAVQQAAAIQSPAAPPQSADPAPVRPPADAPPNTDAPPPPPTNPPPNTFG